MEDPTVKLDELFTLKEQLCAVVPRLFTDQMIYDCEGVLNWMATRITDYRLLRGKQKSEARRIHQTVEDSLKIVSRIIVLRRNCDESLSYFDLLIAMRRHIIELCLFLGNEKDV